MAVDKVEFVFGVYTIGAGVLRNDQQFLYAAFHQLFSFFYHAADGAADKIATHGGDDAEGATVVAAFGNFQVGVVTWCELNALWWHEIGERVVLGYRHHFMNGIDDLAVIGWAADTEYTGLSSFDGIGVYTFTHAARDDDLTVFLHGPWMASMDSCLALSIKPQVLTTTTSAPS
ncbi:Putative membrane-associated oxidoreductase [gamma proteobacterium IMCC2047]|nr:Putative membrane-associated oxidoreductase [gamma proteobacterium IMCC2047]